MVDLVGSENPPHFIPHWICPGCERDLVDKQETIWPVEEAWEWSHWEERA